MDPQMPTIRAYADSALGDAVINSVDYLWIKTGYSHRRARILIPCRKCSRAGTPFTPGGGPDGDS